MKAILFAVMTSVAMTACGPGVVDTTYPILNGYVFSDAGGPEKAIIYRGDAVPKGIVIDARVDKYRVVDNRIIVARRPEVLSKGTNPVTTKLSDTCEHWVIDTQTHAATRVDDKSPDAQLSCNSPYDQEFNPRL